MSLDSVKDARMAEMAYELAMERQSDFPALACAFMRIALETMPQKNLQLFYIETAIAIASQTLLGKSQERDVTEALNLFDAASRYPIAPSDNSAFQIPLIEGAILRTIEKKNALASDFLALAECRDNKVIAAVARPLILPSHIKPSGAAYH